MSDDVTAGLDEDDETYSAIRTVLGSTHRTARWHLTDEVDVLTALGRSSFDLRLVETTGRPVAEIGVTCLLGTVTLVVPPGTLVVLDGNSFLARASSEVAPGAASGLPRIEVTATTVLGRVKVVSSEPDAAVVVATSEHDSQDAAPELAPEPPGVDAPAEQDALPEQIVAETGELVADDPDAAPLAS